MSNRWLGLLISVLPATAFLFRRFDLAVAACVAFFAIWSGLEMAFEPARASDPAIDGGSRRVLVLVRHLAMTAPIVHRALVPEPPAAACVWIGAATVAVGASLRLAAMRVLRRQFTMELGVIEGHELVRHGLYGVVRHPSYLGLSFLFPGFALLMGSVAASVVTATVLAPALAYRIKLEEALLSRRFGDAYEDYRRDTRMLIPFVL